jgi:hypothetical protein
MAQKTTQQRSGAPAHSVDEVRKPVNTLAIVPKTTRITSLGRKAYNVLLHEAQEAGLERDVFRAPLERIVKGVDFDSNDHALIKKHLRAMVSTTVEWQSPTSGEGSDWNVSGLLAHAKLTKERGQVWVEWSYAINLKQELLEPTVFAKLKLEILSQLRSHAGIALYEICTRYKEIGLTSRQHWRWWRPVLSGQPETVKTKKLEYRIFKRDTLKPAIAEVCAITDIEVELVEHREGRFISEIQFEVRKKRQASLALKQPPEPVDLTLVGRAKELGIDEDELDQLVGEYGVPAVATGLEALAARIASAFPSPLRDHFRYLRSIMSGEAAKADQRAHEEAARAEIAALPSKETNAKRQAKWREEWIRRQRVRFVNDISSISPEQQAHLAGDLLKDMEAREVHPSIRKRLVTSGWQHPLVIQEMVRYFAAGAHGDDWDKPTPEQLLAVAAEMGDS